MTDIAREETEMIYSRPCREYNGRSTPAPPHDLARERTLIAQALTGRGHRAGLTYTFQTPISNRVLLEEVAHFRGFGWTNEQIAARVGLSLDAFEQALRRARLREAA